MGLSDYWCLCICRYCDRGSHYDHVCDGKHEAVSYFGPEFREAAERRGWVKR